MICGQSSLPGFAVFRNASISAQKKAIPFLGMAYHHLLCSFVSAKRLHDEGYDQNQDDGT